MSHALVRCNYRCNGGFQHHRFDHCSSSPFSMILLSTCYILPSRGKKYLGNRLVIKKKENPGLKPRRFGIRIFSFGRHYCDHRYYYCFRKKDIEILKICILFLNIVSPSLSVPRGNGYSFMDRVGKLFASKHKFSRALRIRRWSISITI